MLTLLLGSDDFSKKEYIANISKDLKAQVLTFGISDQLPEFGHFLESDLFSSVKFFVLEAVLSKYDLANYEKQAAASANHIIFIEEKLDKRISATKALVSSKYIKTIDFNLPHGRELDSWIVERVKKYKGTISKNAVDALSKAVGRDAGTETKFGGKVVDVKEAFSLWQVDLEIKKLLSFATGREIGTEDVENLVNEVETFDVLKIVNAIGEGKKTEALKLVEGFLTSGAGEDQKSLIIQLNALLSEQFRNIFVLQSMLSKQLSEEEILQKTQWKSGRLFILKKLAQKLKFVKVKESLGKLEHLDEELKTSNTPPRVLLDLILSQVW